MRLCGPATIHDTFPTLACALASDGNNHYAGTMCQAVVNKLVRVFGPRSSRGWLKKKSDLRGLYVQGRLVLRIHDTANGNDFATTDSWLHMGFGNLNRLEFSALKPQLSNAFPPERDRVALSLQHGARAGNLWQCLHGRVDPAARSLVEAWQLSSSTRTVITFQPGRDMEVVRVEPHRSVTLWNPGDERPPVRPRRFRLQPYPPPPVPPPPAPSADRAADSENGDGEDDDGDSVQGSLADRMRELEREADAWSITESEDSDSEDPSSATEADSEESHVSAEDDRPRLFKLKANPAWPRCESAAYGSFVFNPHTNSIGAHCALHGCRINKVAWKCPIGYMCAWQVEGLSPEIPMGIAGRKAHMKLKAKTQERQKLRHSKRLFHRNQAALLPELAPLFEWEQRHRREGGDNEEPRVVR